MIYTMIFGAPVRRDDHRLGTLNRILVNNGVANQFTVHTGLLGGPDRLAPINDVVEASEDGIVLNISEDEWKAYPAFDIDKILAKEQELTPGFHASAPANNQTAEDAASLPAAPAPATGRTVQDVSVVLTNKTQVGDQGALRGLILDTGIPQQLLIDGGGMVPFEQVGLLDENQIALGPVEGRLDGATALEGDAQAPARADGAIPPGTIGQERRHDV
ncbi:MAG TPA: hypothetical protein VE268_12110 [Herpetosiphonaceae bacterium]|nr:hypothetical protein [Herpetosiphonaceae bacterium]